MFFGLNLTTLIIFFMRWPRAVASLGITGVAMFFLTSHHSDVNALTGVADLREGIRVVELQGRERVERSTVDPQLEIHAQAKTDRSSGREVHVPVIKRAETELEVPVQQGPVPSYREGPASRSVHLDRFSELQSGILGLFQTSTLAREAEAGRLLLSGPGGGTPRGSQNLERSD